MATIFGTISGLTLTGAGGLGAGSYTVPANQLWVVFYFTAVNNPQGDPHLVRDVTTFGQGSVFSMGTIGGYYLEFTYVPTINAL